MRHIRLPAPPPMTWAIGVPYALAWSALIAGVLWLAIGEFWRPFLLLAAIGLATVGLGLDGTRSDRT